MITTKSTKNTKTTRLVFLCDLCVLCGKQLNCCLGQRNSTPSLASSLRRGISLIEVLVAMLVAMIGVFGVFVLIAFAVRQVEIGMNEEAAQTLARNAMSDFEAQGLQNVNRWALPEMAAGAPFFVQPINPPLAPIPPAMRSRQVFCIDPWGWAHHGLLPSVDPTAATVKQTFVDVPFTDIVAPPLWPTFPRLSLFDQNPATLSDDSAFNKAMARRLFSGHDDLITEPPTDDFSGPTQVYFSSATGNGGRQYSGRLSWKMFVVQDFAAEGYARFYSAVSLARNPDSTDRVFQVNSAGPYSGGGDLTITELSMVPSSNTIRRGLWMMLMERNAAGTVHDIAFCRVLESDVANPSPSPGPHTVTLQGSDMTPEVGSSVFAVLLPDVIAVYERTMKFETSSDWNAN